MVFTVTVRMIDGELGFVFPDELVKRMQLEAGDTFLVAPHEHGVMLIPTGALLDRLGRSARRRRGSERTSTDA